MTHINVSDILLNEFITYDVRLSKAKLPNPNTNDLDLTAADKLTQKHFNART